VVAYSRLLKKKKIQTRDDFCIENYTTNPGKTAGNNNITEILIPTI